MIKILLTGIFDACAALGGNYAVGKWQLAHPVVAASEHPVSTLEQRKTASMNVPIVKEGIVQGYVILQLVYTVDATAVKQLPLPPEAYMADEAFRAVYADDSLDFRKLEVYDLNQFTRRLVERMRVRLNSDVVKDVLIQEFNFVAKGDLHL